MVHPKKFGPHELVAGGRGAGAFEFKLQAFHMHIMTKNLAIMVPFLSFTYIYNVSKTHKHVHIDVTLVVKKNWCDENMCREGWKAIQMVVKYDNGTLMPLWVANFQFQNPLIF